MKSKDLLGIITGSILGDGSATRGNQLTIQHSIKQKDYLLYKASLLNKDNKYSICITEKLDTEYPYIRLYYNNKTVGTIREKLYIDGNKKITEGILNQLGPIGLAIWYMDDGSLTLHRYPDGSIKSREVRWSTECFSYEDHLLIQDWLKRRYSIDAKISFYKNKYFRIILNATNANKLFKTIEPYIIPSMRYKIDMRYSNSPMSRKPKE